LNGNRGRFLLRILCEQVVPARARLLRFVSKDEIEEVGGLGGREIGQVVLKEGFAPGAVFFHGLTSYEIGKSMVEKKIK
jgi:hypothetical protein